MLQTASVLQVGFLRHLQWGQGPPFQAHCEQLDGELDRALHVRPDERGVHARAALHQVDQRAGLVPDLRQRGERLL